MRQNEDLRDRLAAVLRAYLSRRGTMCLFKTTAIDHSAIPSAVAA